MAGLRSPEAIDRDVRTLKEAVRVVLGGYGGTPSGDPKERLRATEWLHSFQRRDDAWDSCVAVLGAPRGTADNQVGLDEQIFASQALLYKCRRRRAPINGDDVGCLLRLALGFTGRGLRAVLVQLCLGICACAVRHDGWEASKVVPDMVLYCQKASEDAGHSDPGPRVLMLELLTVLPDEATARAGISAPPERRREFLWTLRAGGGAGRLALGVLSELMQPGGLPAEGALGAILRCALAWMQLKAVEGADMLASPVMALALEALESPEACDDACELVTAALEAFTDPGAVEEMLPRVLGRAQALAAAPSEDVCRCLAMVFAAAACSYLPGILKPELAGRWGSLLQIMVGMLEHPSLEIAGLALEFWGMLGELLTKTAAGGGGGIGGPGQRSPPLEESVRHACRVAMLRARYPAVASEGVPGLEAMGGDDKDELEDFRDQVQELLQTLIMPAAPADQQQQQQQRHHRARGGAAGTPPPPPKSGVFGRGAVAGGAGSSPNGFGGSGLSGGSGAMSPSGGGGGGDATPGLYPGRHSSAAVVTPDGDRRSSGGGGDGGGGEGEAGAWAAAAAAARGGAVVLSPVQAGLLEWLEGLAASTTRRALQHDHQRRQSGGSPTAGPDANGSPNSGNAGAAAGAAGGGGDAGRGHHPAIHQAGERGGGAAGGGRGGGGVEGGGNGLPGGDWADVEVALRMLSAVTRAVDLRDACCSGAAASAASADGHVAIVPAEGVGPGGSRGGGGGGGGAAGTGAMEALVAMLPELPRDRRELQKSAAVLVGALASWLARRPGSLEAALQTVLGVLGLEEAGGGRGGGESSMRDKGQDHVGAVALAKVVSAAGPSLAAVPNLPTHLLQRYLDLSVQLQRHRLRPPVGAMGPGAGPAADFGGHSSSSSSPAYPWQRAGAPPGGEVFAGGGGGDGRGLSSDHQRRLSGGSAGGETAIAAAAAAVAVPPPPLHAGSLRLFLGCLCRMLGEAPGVRAGAEGVVSEKQQQRGLGASAGAASEAQEVLRALVEGELRCLGGVLDRRRELAAGAPGSSATEESRAMAEVARDSLSNISLILRKTGPALDTPGLVAHCCGLGGASGGGGTGGINGGGGGGGAGGDAVGNGGGGGGVLVAAVTALGLGEEKMLPHLCRLFEALVWSTSQRIRYLRGERPPPVPTGINAGINGLVPTNSYSHHHLHHHAVGISNGQHPAAAVGMEAAAAAAGGGGGGGAFFVEDGGGKAAAAVAAAAGGLRISAAFGDALAEAFRRRPFARFLEALRCITKELPALGRPSLSPDLGDDAATAAAATAAPPPDIGVRASEWVDQCLWAAAAVVGGGGGGGGGGSSSFSVSVSPRVGLGGVGATPVGGPDAHPELAEALFRLMAEWVKELPVPSLRWLEAWLSVAVSGLAVRHQGPAKAVLGLIQACCAQKKAPQFAATFSAVLRETTLGVAVTRGLLSGICGAMPSWMLEDLVLAVRSLFDCLSPAVASSWVEVVLRDPTFERYSASSEQKVAFSRKLKEDFCNKDWRAFKAGLKAFCGGKKKGTGGTPPVHASAAARRQTPPQHPNPMIAGQQQQHQHLHQHQHHQFNSGGVRGEAVGGGPFGSSGGVVNVHGGGQDATPPPRSMTM